MEKKMDQPQISNQRMRAEVTALISFEILKEELN